MFSNLAQSLRSLTQSPIATAINQAHRMATRQLAAGGAARSTHRHGEDRSGAADFVVPHDIDPIVLAEAIAAKLGRGPHRSDDGLSPVKMMPDGQAVVLGQYVQHLGNGDIDEGRRFVVRLISEIRSRRRRLMNKVNHGS